MFKPVLFLSLASLVAAPAFGQDVWDDYSPWEHSVEGEVVLAIAANDDDKGGEKFLGAASVTGKSTYIFDSGLIIGAVGQIGLQKDHPARAGFSSVVSGNAGSTALTAPYTGASSALVPEHVGPRAALEKAYLMLEGGYGEVRLGRDEGVATQFHTGPEPILNAVTVTNARLDPLGSVFARTDHDVTGPSVKVSYTTPRILGVKVGASYTPDADVRGLDRDPARRVAGGPGVSIEDTWELALNGSRRLRGSGLRIEGAVAWSTAEVSAANFANYGRMTTVSAGLTVSGESWSVGIDHVASDNGVSAAMSDYTASSIGVSKQWGKTKLGVFHAQSRDEFLRIESDATSLELGYEALDDLDIAIAYQDIGMKLPNSASFQAISPDTHGVVIEITRRF